MLILTLKLLEELQFESLIIPTALPAEGSWMGWEL